MMDLRNVREIRHLKIQATPSSQQIGTLVRRAEAGLGVIVCGGPE